jgi:Tol biopolymer transport system component
MHLQLKHLWFVVIGFMFSCIGQNTTYKFIVSGFDISKNDSLIVLTGRDTSNYSSVYLLRADSFKPKLIISGKHAISFFKPCFTSDSKKIVCVGAINNDIRNCALFIMNIDGSDLRQLTPGKEIINHVYPSEYKKGLLYIKAGNFEHYSPIGVNQPHNTDVFFADTVNKTSIKLTNLNSYGAYDVAELDSVFLIIDDAAPDDGGTFIYNVSTNSKFRVEPKKSKRPYSFYLTPKYSKEFNVIGCISPYELHIIDVKSNEMKDLHKQEGHHINSLSFFHKKKTILFTVDSTDGFFMIDFDGKNLKKINLKM